MAYTRQTWVNRQSQANQTRMTHIEDGIYNAYNVSLIAISSTAPSECSTGDKYFNTSDNLIYTATSNSDWSETGETPISDKTYILTTDGSTYAYNGTTLTRIGGSEVRNVYSDSQEETYSCDYINNMDKYSTNEIKTNKVWVDGKPIYRKVIIYTTPLPSGNTNIPHGITDLDTFIDFEVRYFTSTNTIRKDIYVADTYYISVNNIGSENITIAVGSSFNNSFVKTIATLEYTKSTD